MRSHKDKVMDDTICILGLLLIKELLPLSNYDKDLREAIADRMDVIIMRMNLENDRPAPQEQSFGEHLVDCRPTGGGWRMSCSCGWVEERTCSPQAAFEVVNLHRQGWI